MRRFGGAASLGNGIDQGERAFEQREPPGEFDLTTDQHAGASIRNDLDIDLGLEGDARQPRANPVLNLLRFKPRNLHPAGIGQRDRALVIDPDIFERGATADQRREQPAFLAFGNLDAQHIARRQGDRRDRRHCRRAGPIADVPHPVVGDVGRRHFDQRETGQIGIFLIDDVFAGTGPWNGTAAQCQ